MVSLWLSHIFTLHTWPSYSLPCEKLFFFPHPGWWTWVTLNKAIKSFSERCRKDECTGDKFGAIPRCSFEYIGLAGEHACSSEALNWNRSLSSQSYPQRHTLILPKVFDSEKKYMDSWIKSGKGDYSIVPVVALNWSKYTDSHIGLTGASWPLGCNTKQL